MKLHSRWLYLVLLMAGALLWGQQALAYQVSTITGYLNSDQLSSSAFDEQLYLGGNTFSPGAAGSSLAGLDFSLTSNLDDSDLGTFTWTVTNNTGGALTNAKFFTLLDASISFGFDDADQSSFVAGSGSGDTAADFWEIDDAFAGDILANLSAGTLDSSGSIIEGFPSLALGFDIGSLGIGDSILATFSLSDILDGLRQSGYNFGTFEEIFFNGTADVQVAGQGGPGGAAPVPEPSTFVLLGAGLGGLAYMQRRRKKA